MVDYIYLDTDERRRFAQVSHEYLIEQVQRETFTGDSKVFDLTFNHPVKELIWVNDVNSNVKDYTCSFAPLRCDNNAIVVIILIYPVYPVLVDNLEMQMIQMLDLY